MRTNLKDVGVKRYRGRVAGYSYTPDGEKTFIIKEIESLDGQIKLDHVWFKSTHITKYLRNGDEIAFTTNVIEYKKGYKNRKVDYKLNEPFTFNVINHKKVG